ncbi:MAG: hypothetical protein EOO90_21625 [Pedobacter sp.]|nr:MAG: hypothetical protein EOO90_21625 [Pedobacter sp.]
MITLKNVLVGFLKIAIIASPLYLPASRDKVDANAGNTCGTTTKSSVANRSQLQSNIDSVALKEYYQGNLKEKYEYQ